MSAYDSDEWEGYSDMEDYDELPSSDEEDHNDDGNSGAPCGACGCSTFDGTVCTNPHCSLSLCPFCAGGGMRLFCHVVPTEETSDDKLMCRSLVDTQATALSTLQSPYHWEQFRRTGVADFPTGPWSADARREDTQAAAQLNCLAVCAVKES